MKILWDMRLYSFGYRNRGIGMYVSSITEAFTKSGLCTDIVIWGQKECLPQHLVSFPVIEYKPGNWKNDLFHIPCLQYKYGIDLFHYWISCGPLWRIGSGFDICPSIATVFDLGVQLWDNPYLNAVKRSFYWKVQPSLLKKASRVLCISQQTCSDLTSFLPSVEGKVEVLAFPVPEVKCPSKARRQRIFIVLGGAPHKNLKSVVLAFHQFRKAQPDYKLVICGEIKREQELPECLDNVEFADMNKYHNLLCIASGLVFCSLYEGLGLPPLEAMNAGCPLIVSEIPVMWEICNDAAVFVNPLSIDDIARGMRDIHEEHEYWSEKSSRRIAHLRDSGKPAEQLAAIYEGYV